MMNTSTNPFTYGNPISNPARFVGRRAEVEQVYTRLRNAEFESSSIVGERRTGKTSLLYFVAHPAIVSALGLDPDRYVFVYADLQMVDQRTTPTRFWARLLRRVARRIEDGELKAGFERASVQEEIYRQALASRKDPGTSAQALAVLRSAAGVFAHVARRRFQRLRGTRARDDFNAVAVASSALECDGVSAGSERRGSE